MTTSIDMQVYYSCLLETLKILFLAAYTNATMPFLHFYINEAALELLEVTLSSRAKPNRLTLGEICLFALLPGVG